MMRSDDRSTRKDPTPRATRLPARRGRLRGCAGVAGYIVLAGLVAACDGSSRRPPQAHDAATTTQRRAWYQFGFRDGVSDQVTLYYLGHVWDQSADVGEVLETVSRIDETDPTSWTREWRKTAERLEAVGLDSEQRHRSLSASHAYLRAATYFRAALHRHSDPLAAEVRALAQRAVECFGQYLKLSRSPCESVRIPYETTTLPGYFCKSSIAKAPAPVVLFQEGRDGWAEDGRFLADEAMKRGFHVLLFDGPGMGQVLRLQSLPFRPDWENVITPIVNYAVSRVEVDPARIALVSLSMGGFLGPRAATKEHRLKALVANPGVINWNTVYEGFLRQIDPELLPLLDKDEAAFNQRVGAYMEGSAFLHWGLVDSMWHHGVTTPAQLMKELRRYVLGPEVADITARTLVVDAEAEEWGQAKRLFEALRAPKDYLLFTAAETAQIHVQPGAAAISSQRLLEWLESSL